MAAKRRPLCLVTGGAGFIGSHLVDGALKRGYRVRVLDNLSTGKLINLQHVSSQIDWVKGDLQKERDVQKAVRGVDYILHAAAVRAVLRSVDNPLETNEVNVEGTLKVLIASRKARVKRVISTSSSSVYGNTKTLPKTENMIPSPLSPYALQK